MCRLGLQQLSGIITAQIQHTHFDILTVGHYLVWFKKTEENVSTFCVILILVLPGCIPIIIIIRFGMFAPSPYYYDNVLFYCVIDYESAI